LNKRIEIDVSEMLVIERSPLIRVMSPQTTMLLAMKYLMEKGFDLHERVACVPTTSGGYVIGQSE
jgi:hypothetical protein